MGKYVGHIGKYGGHMAIMSHKFCHFRISEKIMVVLWELRTSLSDWSASKKSKETEG
jgi:hypothetical protein